MLSKLWQWTKPSSPTRGQRSRSRPAPERLEARDVPSFLPPVFYDVSVGVNRVAVGDFNNDLVADLVALGLHGINQESAVSVLLGNGDGTFQGSIHQEAGLSYHALATGDFNNDGFLDTAVGRRQNREIPPRVRVLLGNGDGTFQIMPVAYAAGSAPYFVTVADFNGDNWPDALTANADSNDVSVLLNDAVWPGPSPGRHSRNVPDLFLRHALATFRAAVPVPFTPERPSSAPAFGEGNPPRPAEDAGRRPPGNGSRTGNRQVVATDVVFAEFSLERKRENPGHSPGTRPGRAS